MMQRAELRLLLMAREYMSALNAWREASAQHSQNRQLLTSDREAYRASFKNVQAAGEREVEAAQRLEANHIRILFDVEAHELTLDQVDEIEAAISAAKMRECRYILEKLRDPERRRVAALRSAAMDRWLNRTFVARLVFSDELEGLEQ